MIPLAKIDTHAVLEVVLGSLTAVIVLSVAFSLLLLGAVRSSETRREGKGAASIGFGLVGLIGLAAFAAAVIYGLTIIINK